MNTQMITRVLAVASTLTLMALVVSCSFLDVTPRDKVNSKVVYETYDNALKALNGTYDKMSYNSEGFFVSLQSSGIHNFLTAADLMGQDIVTDPDRTQTQGDDYNFTSRTSDKDRTDFFWNFPYQVITVANDMLSQLPNMRGKQHEKLALEGEAKLVRAYCYRLLVNWFQQAYLIDPEAPGVPLYLAPVAEPSSRASMKEVYEMILKDLTTAVENLPEETRTGDRDVPGRDAARALLVRTLMEMGQYEKALPVAKDLANKYPLMSEEEYKRGFSDGSVSECIWALKGSARNGGFSFCNLTLWTQPERRHGRWGLKSIFIDSDFYALFAESDYRRDLILENSEDYSAAPEKKYYTDKFNDPEDASKAPDLLLLRSSEMLLCQAECEARTGAESEAQRTLSRLVQARDPEAEPIQDTGNALLSRIIVERRKELFGEGFALHDIKRYRLPLLRKGNHVVRGDAATGVLYPKDDYHFVLQIPGLEIDNNPNIQQNK